MRDMILPLNSSSSSTTTMVSTASTITSGQGGGQEGQQRGGDANDGNKSADALFYRDSYRALTHAPPDILLVG